MAEHTSRFDLRDTVRLVHDPEKLPRMVVQVSFGGTGIRYNLVAGTSDSWHYEAELETIGEPTKSPAGFKAP